MKRNGSDQLRPVYTQTRRGVVSPSRCSQSPHQVRFLFNNPLTINTLYLDLDTPQDGQRIVTEVPTLPVWEIIHALYKATQFQLI